MSEDAPRDVDLAVRQLVQGKVWALIRGRCFSAQDRDDLRQELLAQVLKRLAHYDPRRGPLTAFAATLVHRCAANLVRARFAAKRDPRRLRSLHALLAASGGTEPHDLDEEVQRARHGRPRRNAAELAGLRADVAALLDALPADVRALAERLMTATPAEAAAALGLSRAGLCDRLRRLREFTERTGFQIYLP